MRSRDGGQRLARLPSVPVDDGLTVLVARSAWTRARGLAGIAHLPADHAMLLPRCRSVHTFGMRFPIDVVFLGAGAEVVRTVQAMPPRRIVICLRARAVLETAGGTAEPFLAAGAGAIRELLDPQPIE